MLCVFTMIRSFFWFEWFERLVASGDSIFESFLCGCNECMGIMCGMVDFVVSIRYTKFLLACLIQTNMQTNILSAIDRISQKSKFAHAQKNNHEQGFSR